MTDLGVSWVCSWKRRRNSKWLMTILSRKQHLEKWFEWYDRENNMGFVVSNNGCFNREISFEWLEHFDKPTWGKWEAVWRILMMDGAESHTHSEFVRVCNSKIILSFRWPPYTTQLLQLLDVVWTQPLKHDHSYALSTSIRRCSSSKIEFLARITSIRK